MKNRKSGQMMIEVLFALSVVVMVLLALMSITTISLRNARYSKNMILSNHYAQQAIEGARAYRNRNGLSVFCNSCCYEEITSLDLTPLPNCNERGIIVGTIFQRKIEVDEDATNRKKITAVISWPDAGCGADNLCETEIVGYLSQWEN